MAVEKQRTIAGEAVFEGIGLHRGENGRIVLRPAPADSGLVVRVKGVEERIRPSLATAEGHCSSLNLGDAGRLATVEHLLAALWGLGVDNAVIELAEGGEVPGLDGSAAQFAAAIAAKGIVEQDSPRSVFIPRQPVSVGAVGAGVVAYPAPDGSFSVTYILDYPESKLARGTRHYVLDAATFAGEIAPARTFVIKEHVEPMLAAGLGRGANSENTLVVDAERAGDAVLRFPDECVRHKILDLIGDLAMVNRRLGVHVVAAKSGHRLNCDLARALAREIDKAEHPHGIMDINEVMACLPHRYPFLLVDRVIELDPKKYIVAVKNMTGNESFFQGHFPGKPIMPGVLQIEALAQAGAIMMLGEYRNKGKLAVLMTAEDVKWRKQVIPGDVLHLHAEAEKMKGRIGVVRAWATVDGEITVEARIKFALIDAKNPS